MTRSIRARTTQLLLSVAIGAVLVSAIPFTRVFPQSTAQAQYVVAAEFRIALSPHGRWQNHSRWGEVWLPDPVPSDWRPYTRGRWVYTNEWGYYWNPDSEEASWGWVAYHYGRWVNDADLGWLWVPGEDWAPAWVDWRRGDDYVGWAPLPPDVIVEYRGDPIYWSFVRPRHLLAPRILAFCVPARDRVVILRRTVIVNRTVVVHRDRNHDRHRDQVHDHNRGREGDRVAVNRGIDPGVIARATGKPVRAVKVEPAVLRGTKVQGAREVDAQAGGRARASVRQTATVIKAAGRVEPVNERGTKETGRLDDRAPKLTHNAGDAGHGRRLDREEATRLRYSPPPEVTRRASPPQRLSPLSPAPRAMAQERREDRRQMRQQSREERRPNR